MAGLDKIVTDELVFGIADRLTTVGGKVSNRLIWSEIGGGSMTTIAASLRRWRERQELKAEEPVQRAPLPEPVGEAMRESVDRLWKAAQAETQKDIERLTQAMNERVAEATSERDEALSELQSTVEELQAAQARGAGLDAELVIARKERDGLRAQLAAAVERAGTAETRAVEIERRADDLGGELGRVHAEAATERERQAQDLVRLRTELDHARAEVATVRATADALAAQQAVQQQRLADEAERQVVHLKGVEAERDQLRKDAGAAREEAARLAGKIEAMTSQHAELLRAVVATGSATGGAAGGASSGEGKKARKADAPPAAA